MYIHTYMFVCIQFYLYTYVHVHIPGLCLYQNNFCMYVSGTNIYVYIHIRTCIVYLHVSIRGLITSIHTYQRPFPRNRNFFTHKKRPFHTQIRVKKRVNTAMQLLMITCMREGLRVCAYDYTLYIYIWLVQSIIHIYMTSSDAHAPHQSSHIQTHTHVHTYRCTEIRLLVCVRIVRMCVCVCVCVCVSASFIFVKHDSFMCVTWIIMMYWRCELEVKRVCVWELVWLCACVYEWVRVRERERERERARERERERERRARERERERERERVCVCACVCVCVCAWRNDSIT